MDFIILKINGEDVSSHSHLETLEVFDRAKDPIIIEVRRKDKSSEDKKVTCNQTANINNSDSCDRRNTTADIIYPEYEFEDVKFLRPTPGMKLGLTLCYEDDDIEGQTEIFIDDIHPQGLAAQDGRLQLGDQIVEINGVRVRTKNEAQNMFVNSKGDICLRVMRPTLPKRFCDTPDSWDFYSQDREKKTALF